MTDIDIENIRLRYIQHKVRAVIPKAELMDSTIAVYEDYLADSIICAIRWYVAGRLTYIEVPATWWDHFKLRWFPKWYLNRWPAQPRTIEAVEQFPELPIDLGQRNTFFTDPK